MEKEAGAEEEEEVRRGAAAVVAVVVVVVRIISSCRLSRHTKPSAGQVVQQMGCQER